MLSPIRISWIFALVVIVAALAFLALAPFGSITHRTDFLRPNYFISRLTPQERLAGKEGLASRRLLAEPAYFSIYTPRPFDQATITIEYESKAPLLELGIRRGGVAWNFERQPIYFSRLDQLARDPNTIQEGGLMLWQKDKRFGSVSDFLQDLPARDRIAVYNYSLVYPYRLAAYRALPQARSVDLGIKGSYVMNTYSNGESLDMVFSLQYQNLDSQSASATVIVYNEKNEPVISRSVTDNELVVRIVTGPLRPGPYRVEMKTAEDTVTTRLLTTQSKISFVGQVRLSAKGRNDFSVYTDSASLTAQTSNPASLQVIAFEEQKLDLNETYRQISTAAPGGLRQIRKIEAARDDIVLSGDGVFAFSAEDILNPSLTQFRPETNMTASGIEYIIARYEPADLQSRSVTFDLRGAVRENNRYTFMIAAPGLSSVTGGLEIKSLSVKLQGRTAAAYLRALFSAL